MSSQAHRHLYHPKPVVFQYLGRDDLEEELTIDRSKIYGVTQRIGQGKYKMTTSRGDEMYIFAYEDEKHLIYTAREAWHQYRAKNDAKRRRVASQIVNVLYDGCGKSNVQKVYRAIFTEKLTDDNDGSVVFSRCAAAGLDLRDQHILKLAMTLLTTFITTSMTTGWCGVVTALEALVPLCVRFLAKSFNSRSLTESILVAIRNSPPAHENRLVRAMAKFACRNWLKYKSGDMLEQFMKQVYSSLPSLTWNVAEERAMAKLLLEIMKLWKDRPVPSSPCQCAHWCKNEERFPNICRIMFASTSLKDLVVGLQKYLHSPSKTSNFDDERSMRECAFLLMDYARGTSIY
jgi:hypothetical protein